MKSLSLAILLTLLVAALVMAQLPDSTKPQPRIRTGRSQRGPEHPVATINGVTYYGGMVWIRSLDDTTALREAGFRLSPVYLPLVMHDEHDTTHVGLNVRWPVDMNMDSLPPFISNVIPMQPTTWPD